MKVLFVGNSHTYFNDMPAMFREILRAEGIEADVVMLTRGGECLANHARSEQVRFNLLYGGFDYVVFQEVESEFPGTEVYENSLEPLIALARRAGTEPILYMNFAPEGKRERQTMLTAAARSAAVRFGVRCAEAGEAFFAVQAKYPAIDLYFTDRRHASRAGSCLAALCLAQAVSGIEPVHAPARLEAAGEVLLDLAPADMAALKEIAQSLKTC